MRMGTVPSTSKSGGNLMGTAAVLIDGGYLANILKRHFSRPKLDHEAFVKWVCQDEELFRVYYYDCLPYQSRPPTSEQSQMLSRTQSFFDALKSLRRFTVREGRLEYRGVDDKGNPVFQQKRVDLQIGLDIATLSLRDKASVIALVSGDSDLIPAVQFAKENGAIVRLIHGPKLTYHMDLWRQADERLEVTQEVINGVLRQ